jgi:colicin import membrane protein
MGRGALVSVGVHGLLLLALAVSLAWRSQTPAVFEAELWAAAPQMAAPRPVEPAPVPVPRAAPPAPTPAPTPAPAPRPAPALSDAQIAIEKAKKAALEEAEKERLEKARIDKAERLKAEREKLERDKAERDKLQREAKAKEDARQREQKLAQEQKEQREKQAEEARLAKLREDNLKRMMGQAGATGAPSSTGTAAQNAAPSASYAGKLVASILPNILMTDTVVGKPAADVEVRAAPSGTILSRRLVKSSGNKDWDDAVLRAIDRTGQLPRDVDGRVPPVLVITFTPQ